MYPEWAEHIKLDDFMEEEKSKYVKTNPKDIEKEIK